MKGITIDMNMTERIPMLMYRIMLSIFIGIFILAAFVSNYNNASMLVYGAFFAFAITKLTKKHSNAFDCVSDTKLLIILSFLCFAVKLLWILFMPMEPKVDYATFYETAQKLSGSWMYPDRYIALFPHLMGYSSFLSIFFTLFGDSVFLAALLNVILTVISGILIYKTVRSMISATAAVCAYFFWIMCPSQTIYNSLVLSDPLYTALILAFVYLITVITKKETSINTLSMVLYGVLAGILLRGVNVNRPIAAILIIALFIWLFVLRAGELFRKASLKKRLPFFAVLLAVYILTGSLWNIYFVSRIGEAPASTPGYNIHVGFNENSGGAWNYEDSALLFSYSDQENATADWAQKQMFEEAKNRIFSGDINFAKLFRTKFSIFLGTDYACVDYCADIIEDKDFMRMVCNSFYYCLLLLSIAGAYKMFNTSHRSAAFILPLYVIGITCAQMLVEVASRYHYSVIPFMIMIMQFFLFEKRAEGISSVENTSIALGKDDNKK